MKWNEKWFVYHHEVLNKQVTVVVKEDTEKEARKKQEELTNEGYEFLRVIYPDILIEKINKIKGVSTEMAHSFRMFYLKVGNKRVFSFRPVENGKTIVIFPHTRSFNKTRQIVLDNEEQLFNLIYMMKEEKGLAIHD